MIIQDKKRYSRRWRTLGVSVYRKVGASRLVLSLILLMALVLYTGFTVGAGMMLHKSGTVGGVVVPMLQSRLAVIPNYINGQLFSHPKKLAIDIKHVDLQKLAYKREQALQQQFLIAASDDYVPAQIRYGDENIPVKLRLKGDMIDHLRWDKWSFRVQVKGDDTLLGMKVFSLQHPKTRNYMYEWLYHKTLERAGLIALRYDFVDVAINGKSMGIYALEEHFSKELIEHNRNREAPIVRFNEDLYWAQSLYLIDFPGRLAAENSGHYLASTVEPFQTSKTVADPNLRAKFEYAAELLEGFRRGEIATHQLFDVRKRANYLAVIELMGTTEWTLDWTDQRFYFNPVTAKLEPIGFDGHIGHENYELMGQAVLTSLEETSSSPISELPTRIFHDPVFYREYVRALEEVSAPEYLDTLLAEVDEELRTKLKVLYREYPYFKFTTGVFYKNQHFIQKMLNPVKGMHAYFERYEEDASGRQLTLKVGNIQGMPLEILGATYLGETPLALAAREVIVPARGDDEPVAYAEVRLQLPDAVVWDDESLGNTRLQYNVLGANSKHEIEIYPWRYLDPQMVRQDVLRQPPRLEEFPFLKVNEEHIVMLPGHWELRQSLIIPEGYAVHVPGGTELDLLDRAMLISHSPVVFNGTEESPIVICSSDGTGQGVAVIQAQGPSLLKHVRFVNLDVPSRPGWELTGAVTFYESKVQILHTQFINARSEDALNVVRSEFRVVDSLFHGTASDAFDVDFGTGSVERTRFVQCSNDALDFSGSVAQVRDCQIRDAGDKAISAGEASQIEVYGVSIHGVNIALASKDRSLLTAENVQIRNSKIGLTAFQKKPEFGPAAVQVTRLDMQETQEPYLVELDSSAQVNGKPITAKSKNVADRFYGATAQETTVEEEILQSQNLGGGQAVLTAQTESTQHGEAKLPF